MSQLATWNIKFNVLRSLIKKSFDKDCKDNQEGFRSCFYVFCSDRTVEEDSQLFQATDHLPWDLGVWRTVFMLMLTAKMPSFKEEPRSYGWIG